MRKLVIIFTMAILSNLISACNSDRVIRPGGWGAKCTDQPAGENPQNGHLLSFHYSRHGMMSGPEEEFEIIGPDSALQEIEQIIREHKMWRYASSYWNPNVLDGSSDHWTAIFDIPESEEKNTISSGGTNADADDDGLWIILKYIRKNKDKLIDKYQLQVQELCQQTRYYKGDNSNCPEKVSFDWWRLEQSWVQGRMNRYIEPISLAEYIRNNYFDRYGKDKTEKDYADYYQHYLNGSEP